MGNKKLSFFGRIKEKVTTAAANRKAKTKFRSKFLEHLPTFDAEESTGQELMATELSHDLSLAFDTYSKGLYSIPCKEIGYILRYLGQNPTEDDLINLVYDANCDWEGLLTRDDFVHAGLVHLQKQADRVDDVRAAFRAFDNNNDGTISKEELKEAMTRYGATFTEDECEEMFSDADQNGDGLIDFDEFLNMMMSDHNNVNYSSPAPDFGQNSTGRVGR